MMHQRLFQRKVVHLQNRNYQKLQGKRRKSNKNILNFIHNFSVPKTEINENYNKENSHIIQINCVLPKYYKFDIKFPVRSFVYRCGFL